MRVGKFHPAIESRVRLDRRSGGFGSPLLRPAPGRGDGACARATPPLQRLIPNEIANCDPPRSFKLPFRASGSLAPIVVAFLSGARFFALIATFSCSNVRRGKRRTGLPRGRLVPCRPAFGVRPCVRSRLSENRLVVSYPRCQNKRTRIMGRRLDSIAGCQNGTELFHGLAQVLPSRAPAGLFLLEPAILSFSVHPLRLHNARTVSKVALSGVASLTCSKCRKCKKPLHHLLSAISALSALVKSFGFTSQRRIERPAVGVVVLRSQPALVRASNRACV
jgi:hypothetical protein